MWLGGWSATPGLPCPGLLDTALSGTGFLPVSGQTYDVHGMFEADVRSVAHPAARLLSDAVFANALGLLDVAAAADLAWADNGRPPTPHHLRRPREGGGVEWAQGAVPVGSRPAAPSSGHAPGSGGAEGIVAWSWC